MAFDFKLLSAPDWDHIRSQLGLADDASPSLEHVQAFVDQTPGDDPLALRLKHELLGRLVQAVAGSHLSALHTPGPNPEPMLLKFAELLAHGGKGPYQANRIINFFRALPEGTAVEDAFNERGRKVGQNIIRRVFKTGEGDNKKTVIIGRYGNGVFICQADPIKITFTLTHDLIPNPLDLMDDRKIPDKNLATLLGWLNYYEPVSLRDSGHSYFTHPQYGPVLLLNVHENGTQDSPYLLPNPLDPQVGIPFGTLAMEVDDPWDPKNLPTTVTTLDSNEGALLKLAIDKLSKKKLAGYSFEDFIKTFENEIKLGLVHHRDAQGRLYWPTEATLHSGDNTKMLSLFRWDPASQKASYGPIIPQAGSTLQDWLDGLLPPEKVEQLMQATDFIEIEQHGHYPYIKQAEKIWWLFVKEKNDPNDPGYYRMYGGSPQL
ncbi:MAG: hypothetical protein ACD_73C00138G0003, partial [uncultured bacterium]